MWKEIGGGINAARKGVAYGFCEGNVCCKLVETRLWLLGGMIQEGTGESIIGLLSGLHRAIVLVIANRCY